MIIDNDSTFERHANESVVFSSENAVIFEENAIEEAEDTRGSKASNTSFNVPSNHTFEQRGLV